MLLFSSAFAADNALLRNGSSIRHERREVLTNGATTRLYLSDVNADFVDVPSADIAGFEMAPADATVRTVPLAPAPKTLAEIVREASNKTLLDEDLLFSV